MMTVSLMLLGEGDIAHFWEWLKVEVVHCILLLVDHQLSQPSQ